jgi:hypothetical protein
MEHHPRKTCFLTLHRSIPHPSLLPVAPALHSAALHSRTPLRRSSRFIPPSFTAALHSAALHSHPSFRPSLRPLFTLHSTALHLSPPHPSPPPLIPPPITALHRPAPSTEDKINPADQPKVQDERGRIRREKEEGVKETGSRENTWSCIVRGRNVYSGAFLQSHSLVLHRSR